MATRALLALAALALLAVRPSSAVGQLISPGKLSEPHADLEGIRNCTLCHQLREAGTSADRCLECHEPLAARMLEGRGYHGRMADATCDRCHKEHFGREFDLIQLDSLAFDHEEDTGYALAGRHAAATCRSCHREERIVDSGVMEAKGAQGALARTFLGLGTACTVCHQADTPHDAQFDDRSCADCHDEEGWEEAGGFDHARSAYPLTGLHRMVACAECHEPLAGPPRPGALRYAGVPADRCTACHQDEHGGAMPGRCESCHGTSGWNRVDRSRVESSFDHTTTGYVLRGAHADAACADCHRRPPRDAYLSIRFEAGTESQAYPKPVAGTCAACHQDRHEGVFAQRPEAGACDACHGEGAWTPADYGIARHNQESGFVLDATHRVVPCADCHESDGGMPRFRLEATACGDCHAASDPHAGQFPGRSCEGCHAGASFRIPDFDHAATRFPLDGAHEGVACVACHGSETGPSGDPFVRYTPVPHECADCHGAGT